MTPYSPRDRSSREDQVVHKLLAIADGQHPAVAAAGAKAGQAVTAEMPVTAARGELVDPACTAVADLRARRATTGSAGPAGREAREAAAVSVALTLTMRRGAQVLAAAVLPESKEVPEEQAAKVALADEAPRRGRSTSLARLDVLTSMGAGTAANCVRTWAFLVRRGLVSLSNTAG